MPVVTRSHTECLVHRVFDTPLLLDAIFQHLVKDDNFADAVTLKCVLTSKQAVDVVEQYLTKGKLVTLERNTFLDTLRRSLVSCEQSDSSEEKLLIACNLFEYIIANKNTLYRPVLAELKAVVIHKLEDLKTQSTTFKEHYYSRFKQTLL